MKDVNSGWDGAGESKNCINVAQDGEDKNNLIFVINWSYTLFDTKDS